jgi:hypothetical protein
VEFGLISRSSLIPLSAGRCANRAMIAPRLIMVLPLSLALSISRPTIAAADSTAGFVQPAVNTSADSSLAGNQSVAAALGLNGAAPEQAISGNPGAVNVRAGLGLA